MRTSDDAQIYQDMRGAASLEDIAKMQRVMHAWAGTLDKLDDGNDVRTVFMACVQIRISVCERAIERYAAMALMKRSPKMTAN
jgi:hypothetical protein